MTTTDRPSDRHVMFARASGVRTAREALDFDVTAFLRSRGWNHTSSTPDSYWMWELDYEGRRLLVDTEVAVRIEEHIEETARAGAAYACEDDPQHCGWYGDHALRDDHGVRRCPVCMSAALNEPHHDD